VIGLVRPCEPVGEGYEEDGGAVLRLRLDRNFHTIAGRLRDRVAGVGHPDDLIVYRGMREPLVKGRDGVEMRINLELALDVDGAELLARILVRYDDAQPFREGAGPILEPRRNGHRPLVVHEAIP